MYSQNKTIDLFWRTVEVCALSDEHALQILHNIEKKHGISIGSLPKSHDYRRRNIIKLKKDDIDFIRTLKKRGLLKQFCDKYGINRNTLVKAFERGNMSILIYSRFTRAKKSFTSPRDPRYYEVTEDDE